MAAQRGYIARADPLVFASSARTGDRLKLAILLAAIPAGCVGAGAAGVLLENPAIAIAAIFVGIATVLGAVYSVSRTGTSVAHKILSLRTVNLDTGAPAGKHLLRDLFMARLGTFDLKRGRDPISPALQPFDFSSVSDDLTRSWSAVALERAWAMFDSGEHVEVKDALRVGRSPQVEPGEKVAVFSWPDISRTLSKTHLTLEWDGSHLWVTDMGSTNGTVLSRLSEERFLRPYERVKVPSGTTVVAGDRRLTLSTTT